MQVFFNITIDTEIDRLGEWGVYNEQESYISVLKGIPNRLTPSFNRFDVKPTYLLSSEVIENESCLTVLKNIDNCELGTHLHGDLVEPERKIYELRGNTPAPAMQCSYSNEIEYEKLKNLTDLFYKKIGYTPTSFRAGRFAAGANTINSLEKLGYLVDSSVTPYVDWNYPEGRANFLHASNQPYFPNRGNIIKIGDSKILEVPVSIFCSRFRQYFHYFDDVKILRHLNTISDKIFPIHWLRPSFQSSNEMTSVIKKMMKQHHKSEIIVLNMMLHSMEIVPNASPYAKNEKDCKALLDRIGKTLEYGKKNNFKFVTLSELYPYFKEG